jgi:hypothetical protein
LQASLALSGKRATIQSQIPESGLADAVLNVIRRSPALGFRVSQAPIRNESGAHSKNRMSQVPTRHRPQSTARRDAPPRCGHPGQRIVPIQMPTFDASPAFRPSPTTTIRGPRIATPIREPPALLEDAIAAAASAVAAYGALYASGRLLYEGDVCDLADAHAACHPGREPAG